MQFLESPVHSRPWKQNPHYGEGMPPPEQRLEPPMPAIDERTARVLIEHECSHVADEAKRARLVNKLESTAAQRERTAELADPVPIIPPAAVHASHVKRLPACAALYRWHYHAVDALDGKVVSCTLT